MKIPLVFAALGIAASVGNAAPVLESLAPVAVTFIHETDFRVVSGTGFGDVTAALTAVDLLIPSPISNSSTSGCEAADFAGFVVGTIALIQRGVCTFESKVANAEAAGAAGVLLFNEGNPGRTDPIFATLGVDTSTLPVLFASFAVGDLLRNGFLDGPTGTTIRMRVGPEDAPSASVPEPASLALFGIALAAAGVAGRRRG